MVLNETDFQGPNKCLHSKCGKEEMPDSTESVLRDSVLILCQGWYRWNKRLVEQNILVDCAPNAGLHLCLLLGTVVSQLSLCMHMD